MVTSKERNGSKTGAIALLFSAAVMLFVLLFGGVASADQAADTTNAGVGGANTGVNGGVGNGSTNGANSDQTANAVGAGDDAVAPNNGGTGNSSQGNANITTGDANATGNSATNNIQQTVVEGHNGAIVLVDQGATVTNIGIGIANTGGNIAIGNASDNTAGAIQVADATGGTGDAVASNNATVRNNSGGDARIDTGDANAVGSTSTNNVNQTFDGDFSGLGVVVLVDQGATVTNIGIGVSNTGLNGAIGNGSTNDASMEQDSAADGAADAVAANNANVSTNSGGSAGIITGDANAVGNVATNNVSQIVNVNATGTLGSIVLTDQSADVANVGISLSNTGLNLAVGNLSDSTSNAIQGAVSGAGPPAGDAVASNDGIASTESNGDASITTGNASSVGNRSTTNLTQVVDVNTDGSAIVLTDQAATVINLGIALSNTGGNAAIGNASLVNDAALEQTADNAVTGDADDVVAANFGSATTNSDGSADINTGNADALGNASTTNLAQTTDANSDGGFTLTDQVATVGNIGIGIANSGLNIAVGNISDNTAAATQEANVNVTGDTDDSVASNFGDTASNSDGSADITTGTANSVGNNSAATTNVAQTVDTNGANVLTDQEVTAIDLGIGVSNSGLNFAIGNVSTNDSFIDQSAAVSASNTDDVVASNFGDSATNSDGSASITTGNATSLGSAGHTNIAQTVDASDADGFVLSDQTVTNVNIGAGIANTGLNFAFGNVSTNTSNANTQDAGIDALDVDGDAVSANFGSSSAASNGSAEINTGHAAAAGQRSTVNVAQTVDANGDGFVMPDQTVTAVNIGIGLANTGVNFAIGNASTTNDSVLTQTALVDVVNVTGDVVASNDGTSSVASDGSADITTGNANGVGNDNEHTLTISQTADANGSGFLLGDQTATAVNLGVGIANTGANFAFGNVSTNSSTLTQGGPLGDMVIADDIDGDVVASNNGNSSTSSDGSATINTGFADSFGNASTTTIAQTSDFNGEGFVLTDQVAVSANIGIGVSNTGLNFAFGNVSDNSNEVDQTSLVDSGDIFGDVVSANTANASTTSDGSADITTGVARSVGNRSTTALAQTNDATIDGNGFVLSDQEAAQIDLGVGIANTGANFAFGNASIANDTLLTQDSEVTATNIGTVDAPVDVVSSNSANSSINSNGSASINTGAAESTGNWTRNSLYQVNDANINGGGFVLSDQIAVVANIGIGVSNTGVNFAFGNISDNSAAPSQTSVISATGDINAGDVVSSNAANSTSNSDGSADITTGDARTIGNDGSHTTAISQLNDASIEDAGFVLSDQDATVVNLGVGIANSGVNIGIGNASTNTIDLLSQDSEVTATGDINADDVVSANTLASANNSDGSASIDTGDAEGVGNRSTTTVSQVADNDVTDGSFVDNDQIAVVGNIGFGIGNSGLNLALGNGSTNTQGDFAQISSVNSAAAIDAEGDVVSANTADITNSSNGSADVTTGNAGGYGNISTTTVDSDDATVLNIGLGLGNSGLNAALGNLSTNTVTGTQTSEVTGAAVTADDIVASNTANNTNDSNGSASVDTGDAVGYGNTSTTTVFGDAIVLNLGLGLSNSGLNAGLGNVSTNTIDTTETASVDPATADDDAVANNALTGTNSSDGTVDITTGDAYALGNRSATGIVESESATTINLGLGLANTGLNLGAGNLSTNTILDNATATSPGGVASNSADLNNTSDGSVDILTGNANAFGNIASNATCQGVGFSGTCPQPTLPPLPPKFPVIPGGDGGSNNGGGGTNTPNTPGKPVQQPLARTGASAGTQVLFGFLLLAIGALLRRKARTA